jgi:hypothetical protein
MSTPIDLQAEFGHRWQIGLDEAAAGRWKDPWYYQVLCRYGEIVPWGGDLLGASTHHGGSIAKRLLKLPGVDAIHDGDDGATAVFHRRDLRAVAALLKPRRARRPNPAQLAALQHGRLQRRRRS